MKQEKWITVADENMRKNQTLKNRHCPMVFVFACEARGVFCEMLGGGVPPGHWIPSYQRDVPIQAYTTGARPPGFVLQVWWDFIRFVVQRFTKPWRKFPEQQTHQKLYTRRTRQFEIYYERRSCNHTTRLTLL